jgi:hypothetical protein
MPDSVDIKQAIAHVGAVDVEVLDAGEGMFVIGVAGHPEWSYPVKGYDAALAEADTFAAQVAAHDAKQVEVVAIAETIAADSRDKAQQFDVPADAQPAEAQPAEAEPADVVKP